jgi:hypothetical protein
MKAIELLFRAVMQLMWPNVRFQAQESSFLGTKSNLLSNELTRIIIERYEVRFQTKENFFLCY